MTNLDVAVHAEDGAADRRRSGRARVTTHGELSNIALELFLENGFEETTIDDIAHAAGIGRRTLFRYFPSKNDLPWGDFGRLLDDMSARLASVPDDIALIDALREAVIAFNFVPPEEVPLHRERLRLLLNVPALVAHSTLRYASWRQVVAEFAARRRRQPVQELEPQAIAWACLGLCLASYEQWLAHDESDLSELLDTAFRRMAVVLQSGMP